MKVTLKVTFAVLNFLNPYLRICSILAKKCLNKNWNLENIRGYYIECRINAEGLTHGYRHTHVVTGELSQKRCKIVTLLLQTTNRKWYLANQIAISDDLQWPSWSFTYCRPSQMWFFVQLCNIEALLRTCSLFAVGMFLVCVSYFHKYGVF